MKILSQNGKHIVDLDNGELSVVDNKILFHPVKSKKSLTMAKCSSAIKCYEMMIAILKVSGIEADYVIMASQFEYLVVGMGDTEIPLGKMLTDNGKNSIKERSMRRWKWGYEECLK